MRNPTKTIEAKPSKEVKSTKTTKSKSSIKKSVDKSISKKEQFRSQPYIDPDTKNVIPVGGKEYKQYEKKYGEPYKVRSPKSHSLITVNGGAYKTLIKDGYTDQQIFEYETINKEKEVITKEPKGASKKELIKKEVINTKQPKDDSKKNY